MVMVSSGGRAPLQIVIVLMARGASAAAQVSTAALTRYLESMCECMLCTLAHRRRGDCKMFSMDARVCARVLARRGTV